MLLYHRIPDKLVGDELYPLNNMKDRFPGVYKAAVVKYKGRESVMNQVIPFFNCLWNDVLFLSPVHPQAVNGLRRKYGITSPLRRWFVIDSASLDQEQLVLFRHRPEWFLQKEPTKEEYVRFSEVPNEERVSLSKLTEAAEWAVKKFGKDALYFSCIPHILYHGSINITDLPVIVSA